MRNTFGILLLLLAQTQAGVTQSTNSADSAFSGLANATQANAILRKADQDQLDAILRKAEQDQLDAYYQGWDDTWQKDLPSALAAAKAGNKPILVYISGAPWATDSQAFESTVLTDDYTMKKLMADFVLLKYVITRNPSDLPVRLSGEMQTIKRDTPYNDGRYSNAPSTKLLPLFIVLDPSGKFVTGIMGYNGDSPERFRSTLNQEIDKAKTPQPNSP